MKYGRSLQELAIELDRQAKVKKDYVATAGAMQMTAVNENFDLVIGNTPFQLNENAHRQLGLQLKIPAAAPKVVELAAKEFDIRQSESEGILGHLIAGGDLSLYGLANAVTRHAQDVQSYDRSTELEATGYKIITMQPALLKRWNEEVIF